MNNKILFWQTSDWYDYNLAYSLQENDLRLYAIIDTVKKPKEFFLNQKFVNYEKIWFYHDAIKKNKKYSLKYLEKFETKYNLNLWLLAYNERIFYNFNPYYTFSTDEVLSILEQECKFFESILEQIKPEFLIISLPWQHQGELLVQMCKAKGIGILMINTSELGGGSKNWTISEGLGKNFYNKKTITNNSKNLSFKKLREQLENWKSNENMRKISQEKPDNRKLKRMFAGFEMLSGSNENAKTHFSYYGRNKTKIIKNEIMYELQLKKRESFINKNFNKKYNQTDKIIYFPLHMEEERSLLIDAPFFTNQIEIIKHIVKSLPIGYQLFVKEHPFMKFRGWREISEYKEMMNLPNVKMIHHTVNSLDLIKDCELVISINSTAGFEAAFYEKPSINFQRRGYSVLSSSFVVEELNKLPQLIRLALQTKVNPEELDLYVQSIMNNLFEFNYMEYIKQYDKTFHRDGNLVDVSIDHELMKKFLEEHKSTFDRISLEYIKRINAKKKN